MHRIRKTLWLDDDVLVEVARRARARRQPVAIVVRQLLREAVGLGGGE